MLHGHSGILLSLKIGMNSCNMNEPWQQYAKYNKWITKEQISHVSMHVNVSMPTNYLE